MLRLRHGIRHLRHLVLDTLRTQREDRTLHYWRDKSGREIDFVIKRPGQKADAIECKINPDRFDSEALLVFRAEYPEGDNYVLSPAVKAPYSRRHGGHVVRYCGLDSLPWARGRG